MPTPRRTAARCWQAAFWPRWALLVVAVLGAGAVPAACGALLGKKPESLMAMAAGSLACAFVGAVSYRCIMWLITVPIANLFLNVL